MIDIFFYARETQSIGGCGQNLECLSMELSDDREGLDRFEQHLLIPRESVRP
jgi:hypothetical protein